MKEEGSADVAQPMTMVVAVKEEVKEEGNSNVKEEVKEEVKASSEPSKREPFGCTWHISARSYMLSGGPSELTQAIGKLYRAGEKSADKSLKLSLIHI